MFSYLAFKGMRILGDVLQSPTVPHAVWREENTPYGRLFAYKAGEGDLDKGYGIFAATFDEALTYASEIFLIAPDPTHRVALGTSGWRAEKAFVLLRVGSNIEGAHEEILRAFLSGYPQVYGILGDAFVLSRNKSLVASVVLTMGVSELCRVFSAPNGFTANKIAAKIADALLSECSKEIALRTLLAIGDAVQDRAREAIAAAICEHFPDEADKFLNDPDPLVRCSAYGALPSSAVSLLQKGIYDKNSNVRSVVLKRYICITGDVDILFDHPDVQLNVIRSLLGERQDELVKQIVYKFAKGAHLNAGAVVAIVDYIDAGRLHVPVWHEVLDAVLDRLDEFVQYGGAAASRLVGSVRQCREIPESLAKKLAQINDFRLRKKALTAVNDSCELNDKEKAQVAKFFFADDHLDVLSFAIRMYYKINKDSDILVGLLPEQQNALLKDAYYQEKSLLFLIRYVSEESRLWFVKEYVWTRGYTPSVIPSFEYLAVNGEYSVKRALLNTLVSCVPPDTAFNILCDMLRDSNPRIRARAKVRLKRIMRLEA